MQTFSTDRGHVQISCLRYQRKFRVTFCMFGYWCCGALWEGPEGALEGGRIEEGLIFAFGKACALLDLFHGNALGEHEAHNLCYSFAFSLYQFFSFGLFFLGFSTVLIDASFSESNIASSSIQYGVSQETPVHEKIVSKRLFF